MTASGGSSAAALPPTLLTAAHSHACRHWNEAFCTSAALNSELRADFARLSQGLSEGSDNTIPPDASAEFDRRCSSLAAWLARRAGLVHSLRIDWPSQDSSVPLSAALQQPMRYLTHLEIMCSDHRLDRYTAYPSLRFADVACLASCQPQLTGLVFGRKPDCMQPANMLQEEPAMTWLSSLQRLQRLQLPGFYLQPATAAALASMTGLSALDVNLDSTAAQRALQAALPPLRGLTSLSAMLPDWRHYPGAEGAAEDAESPLDVCGLPRLATLRLNRGGVRGLSCAAMTWLQLNDTDFEMEVCPKEKGKKGKKWRCARLFWMCTVSLKALPSTCGHGARPSSDSGSPSPTAAGLVRLPPPSGPGGHALYFQHMP